MLDVSGGPQGPGVMETTKTGVVLGESSRRIFSTPAFVLADIPSTPITADAPPRTTHTANPEQGYSGSVVWSAGGSGSAARAGVP